MRALATGLAVTVALGAAAALAADEPAAKGAAAAADDAADDDAAAGDAAADDAADDFGDDFGDVEDFEDVEAAGDLANLEDLDEGESAGPVAEIVGYFHPALVHMPAAWLLLLLLVDFVGLIRRDEIFQKAGTPLAVLAWISFPPAAISGILRFEHLGLDGEAAEPALLHRNMAFLAFGLLTLAVVTRWRAPALGGALRWVYLALVGAAVLVVAVAGHFGGAMVFGDLPF